MSQSLDTIRPVNWAPLKPGEDFRIIQLAARSSGEPLTATLKCASFEAMFNKYLAISYRWGDGSLNETITCNGHTVRISTNLYSALWRIRQPTQAINLWCDALCIKQGADDASIRERDQQVPRMGRIYGSAVRVIIDLGDDDGTLSKVAEGINAIVRTPQNLRKRVQFEADPAEYLGLPPFTDPMWDALETFLSRPWFRRLWCVQEAVLARDIRVMFGPHFMTLEQLVSTASVYALVSSKAIRTLQVRTWSISKYNAPGLATMSLLATWHMRQARINRAENYAASLCQLMMSTMSQDTTDRRDRVYALYGMLGPQGSADLPVNYAESTAELGVRLSEFFARSRNGIWMLVHSCGVNSAQPSWTVDLNLLGARQIYDALYVQTKPDGTNSLYSAGGGTRTADIKLHALPGCLEVYGVIADVVEHTPAMYTLPADALLGESEQRMTPAVMLKYITWLASIV